MGSTVHKTEYQSKRNQIVKPQTQPLHDDKYYTFLLEKLVWSKFIKH